MIRLLSPNHFTPTSQKPELQSQGAEGEAVIIYCEPLATPNLEASGFPVRVNKMAKSALSLEFAMGDIRKAVHVCYIDNNNEALAIRYQVVNATLGFKHVDTVNG